MRFVDFVDDESSNEEDTSNETKSLEYIKQNAGNVRLLPTIKIYLYLQY